MKKVVLFIVSFYSIVVGATVTVNSGNGLGTYTSNVNLAKKTAAANHRFIFAIQGQNDGGCMLCEGAAGSYGNLGSWSEKNGIPLVYGDYVSPDKTAYNWVKSFSGATSFPQAVVVAEDGTTKLAWFSATSSSIHTFESGNRLKLAGGKSGLIDMMHACIEYDDNKVSGAWKLKVPEDGAALWGVYQDYGTNTLRSYVKGIYRYTDPVDWYVLNDAPARGKAFRVAATTVTDPKAYGRVRFFGSKDDATAGKNDLVPEVMLTDLLQGVVLPEAGKGTYVKVYRTDDVGEKENVDVQYILEVSQVIAREVGFAFTREELETEEDKRVSIPVGRLSADIAESVLFKIEDVSEAGYEKAVLGTDFTVGNPQESEGVYRVDFKVGELTNNVELTILRGTVHVERPPRAFRVRLDTEDISVSGYAATKVHINDIDRGGEHEIYHGATTESTNIVECLNGTNSRAEFALTNMPSTVGSIYYVSIDPMTVADYKSGKLYARAKRYDPEKMAYELIDEVTFGEKGYANLVFGCASETGLLTIDGKPQPEVKVEVSRDPASTGEYPTFRYTFRWQRFDRPTVTFDGVTERMVSSADVPLATQLVLRVNSLADIVAKSYEGRLGTEPKFKFDVRWQTSDPIEGEKATADDYVKGSGEVSVSATNKIDTAAGPTVELLRKDAFSSPDRSFRVQLEPSADEWYVLGNATNFTFTFRADTASAAASEASPKEYAVNPSTGAGKTEYLVSETRNVSYTNSADWIRYTADNTNGFFRLSAEEVLLRPTDADVRVYVYTNGVHDAAAALAVFSLASLTNSSPCLPFAGVTNKTIDVCVSNAVGTALLAEYKLKFREWQVAEGGALDEADPADDVRTGATSVTVTLDGTNIVRTLHGCDAPGYVDGQGRIVNDTNDWFRVALGKNDRYSFTWTAFGATNAVVRADFFRNDSEEAFTNVTGLAAGAFFIYDTGADDEEVFVRLSRETLSREVASVAYQLRIKKFEWPTIGFDPAIAGGVEVTNDVAEVTLPVRLSLGDLRSIEADVGLTASDWVRQNVIGECPESVSFGPDTTETNLVVRLRHPADGYWRGDWSFGLSLAVDGDLYRTTEPTNLTVRVVDATPQKDISDPLDDSQVGATNVTLSAEGYACVIGHLNGVDARKDSYADMEDWLVVLPTKAEKFYRFTLDYAATNAVSLCPTVWFICGSVTNSIAFDELVEKGFEVSCEVADTPIYVQLIREKLKTEVPVSLRYALEIKELPWSTFALSGPTEVTNDVGDVGFTVTRSANTNRSDTVVLVAADGGSGVLATDYVGEPVSFAPGEERKTVQVPLAGMKAGYWIPEGSFDLSLEPAEGSPCVSFGTPKEVTVTVKDGSGVPENDCPADDPAPDDPQMMKVPDYKMTTKYQSNTNNMAPGLPYAYLNGSDIVDWHKFVNVRKGRKYRFSVEDLSGVNADGVTVGLEIQEIHVGSSTPCALLTDLASENATVVEATDGYGFVARVFKTGGSPSASVRYVLKFRELPCARIDFLDDTLEVSEKADAAYVSVACYTEPGVPLEEDAGVWICPTEGGKYPAKAGTDFDPTPVEVVWKADEWSDDPSCTCVVKRAAVRLFKRDARWEGMETFRLKLENHETYGSDIGERDQIGVTIVDADAKEYGTVGLTGIRLASDDDFEKVSSSRSYAVREGDVIRLRVTRVGGQAGYANGVFTWKDGKKTVGEPVTWPLFAGESVHEEQVNTNVVLTVPSPDGFQAKRTLTLSFTLKAASKTVTVTKGTPEALKFAVTDQDYGGTVASYAAEDRTKVDFAASGDAWYVSGSGALAASTPTAGKSVMLSASVTGPARLCFTAVASEAEKCLFYATVLGNKEKVQLTCHPDGAANEIPVGAGTKTVKIYFERPSKSKAKTSDAASVALEDVRVERDADFNGYGTFVGAVAVRQEQASDFRHGYATLTVSSSGKLSGKFRCSDRTWTIASTTDWKAGGDVVAKSGTLRQLFKMSVEVDGRMTLEGDNVTGKLARDMWGDQPLQSQAAEALARCAGYYTMSLAAPESGGYGSGYLTFMVSSSGKIKAAGHLADGKSVSLSSVLTLGVEGSPYVTFYTSPSTYGKGWFEISAEFVVSAENVRPVLRDRIFLPETGFHSWVCTLTGDKGFNREVGVEGGWYDTVSNLYDHYNGKNLSVGKVENVGETTVGSLKASARYWATDENHAVSLSFDEAGRGITVTTDGDERLFTMDFSRATGVFTGSFRIRYAYGKDEKTTLKSSAYRGVLTPWRANMLDGVEGRGFFTLSGKSHDVRLVQSAE